MDLRSPVHDELTSSPLRVSRPKTGPHTASPGNRVSKRHVLKRTRSVSATPPSKKCKMVMFSDDLVTDLEGSSPVKSSPLKPSTRMYMKPILKNANLSSSPIKALETRDTLLDALKPGSGEKPAKLAPNNPNYWQQGTVIQLSSEDLSKTYARLILGSIHVLSIDTFKMRFEVYATLNQLISVAEKHSTSLFAERMAAILSIVRKDISRLEENLGIAHSDNKENYDAMDVRKLYQCLKFATAMINILFRLGSNYYDTIMWYYKHATEVLQNERLSRGILGPYIAIIKEVTPLLKSQRDFFNANNLPALALNAVLQMRQLNSSAIISDRFLALRSLVTHFPGTMSSRIQRWLPSLLVNVFRMPPVIQAKCQTIAIQTLFETARSFIDDTAALSKIQMLMDSPVPEDITFFFQGDDIQGLYDGKLLVEFVLEELRISADVEESKNAFDIWTAITILVGGPQFHKWPPLESWIGFLFACQHTKNDTIKRKAIYAWRAVIHNTCYYSLANSSFLLKVEPKLNNVKDIIALLLRLFNELEHNAWINDVTVANEINSLALSIIYTLLNQKQCHRWHVFYWTEIITPLLQISLLRPQQEQDDEAYRLFRQLMMSSETNQEEYNPLRCLSHESVDIKEIIPLSQKWVHANSASLSGLVESILAGELDVAVKFDTLKLLINKIKLVVKRELKSTEGTQNLIKCLPKWNVLLKDSKGFGVIDYVDYLTIVFDTFDKNDLLGEGNFVAQTLECMSEVLLDEDLKLVVNKVFESVDPDSLATIVDELSLRPIYTSKLPYLLREVCKSKEVYLKISGKILTYCDNNYEEIVDDILAMSPTQFVCAKDFLEVWLPVNMHLWKLQALGYLAIKAHGATQVNVRALVVRFLKIKIESHVDTMNILRFMIANDLHDFLYQCSSAMFEASKTLENLEVLDFNQLWKAYLLNKSNGCDDFKVLDKLLLVTFMYSQIDVVPYIQNRWDEMPKLKKRWLKKYGELTYTEENNQNEGVVGDDLKLDTYDSMSLGSSLFSLNASGKDGVLSSSPDTNKVGGEDVSEVSMSDNKDSWSSHAEYEVMKHRLELKGSNVLSPRVEVPMTQEDENGGKVDKNEDIPLLEVIAESSTESLLEKSGSLRNDDSVDTNKQLQLQLQLQTESAAYTILANRQLEMTAESESTYRARRFARLVAEMKTLVGEDLLGDVRRLSQEDGTVLNSALSELIDVALHIKGNLLK